MQVLPYHARALPGIQHPTYHGGEFGYRWSLDKRRVWRVALSEVDDQSAPLDLGQGLVRRRLVRLVVWYSAMLILTLPHRPGRHRVVVERRECPSPRGEIRGDETRVSR